MDPFYKCCFPDGEVQGHARTLYVTNTYPVRNSLPIIIFARLPLDFSTRTLHI
jgi:hypothetical protein